MTDLHELSARPPSPAMQRALDHIWRAFGNPNRSALNMARTMMRDGAADPMCRARYEHLSGQAFNRGLDLDGALIALNHELMAERKRREIARRYFAPSTPFKIETMKEARLMLRWLRRHRPEMWVWVLSALTTPCGRQVFADAAE